MTSRYTQREIFLLGERTWREKRQLKKCQQKKYERLKNVIYTNDDDERASTIALKFRELEHKNHPCYSSRSFAATFL